MTVSAPQSAQAYKATVEKVESVRDNIKIITLRPEQPFAYQAGQYININFSDFKPRSYSIACAPKDTIEIHIKRGKGNASNYVMDSLHEGEEITFTGPQGSNIYQDNIDGPILAIAGGLGITPIKAIAEEACGKNFAHPFILYWGTIDEQEHYLETYFQDLAKTHQSLDFVPVTGNDMRDIISKNFHDLGTYHIYVSGPPAMIGAIIPLLLDKGADRTKISYDQHPEAANLKI